MSVATDDTKRRLRDAAITTVRERGIAGVSARTVAAHAGTNQASIYYHFGSLTGLLDEAALAATAARVDTHRERFATVATVEELVELARTIHAEERELGNLRVLAQMLAGAHADPDLAPGTGAALQLWVDEVAAVLHRLLDGTPIADVVDVPTLARAISAAFVGLELVDGLDGGDDLPTLDALGQLAALVQVILDLGPVASAALRRRLDRGGARAD